MPRPPDARTPERRRPAVSALAAEAEAGRGRQVTVVGVGVVVRPRSLAVDTHAAAGTERLAVVDGAPELGHERIVLVPFGSHRTVRRYGRVLAGDRAVGAGRLAEPPVAGVL